MKWPRIRISTLMLLVVVAAMSIALAMQGRKLSDQDRRISRLEAAEAAMRRQSVQLINGINGGQAAAQRELRGLRREMAALQAALGDAPGAAASKAAK